MKPASAAVALLLGGCAVGQIPGVLNPTLNGGIVVRNGGAETRWTPDRCLSGDRAYFAGFDFASTRDGARLRAALDPIEGPAVLWTSAAAAPAQQPLRLRRSDCSSLDLAVEPTAWRVNEVREFSGHIALLCTAADGTRIEGRIDVDHCH
jgi:hypothetical protein